MNPDQHLTKPQKIKKNYLVCFTESEAGSREAEVDSSFEATQLDVATLVCVIFARLKGNGGLGAHCSLENL